MKKLPLLLALILLLTITGCGQNRVEDLAQDIEQSKKIEQQRHMHLPNNKEQNREKLDVDPQVVAYADEYGFQLDQMYLQFDELAELFYSESISKDQVNRAKQSVSQIQELSKTMQKKNPPVAFEHLYIIHDPLDVELHSLASSLEDFDPNNELDFRRARLYFESVVTTHKLMELEYRITLEELGIK